MQVTRLTIVLCVYSVSRSLGSACTCQVVVGYNLKSNRTGRRLDGVRILHILQIHSSVTHLLLVQLVQSVCIYVLYFNIALYSMMMRAGPWIS